MFWRRKSQAYTSARDTHPLSHSELIQLRRVVKTFDTPAGKFAALRGVDLRVNAGEFVAVIGKSGSGKSTLINMIAGIDRPTSGEVFVGDTAVHRLSEAQMAVWRGKNVGIVFQFFQLLPTLTVLENVMLPMDFCNVHPPAERPRYAMHLLEQMEMAEHAHKLPAAISGGQQQRVAIARALANDPPILLADEPTGNLDSQSADAVFRLFERLVAQGKTILMVTHDQDLAQRVTRAVQIVDGEIIEQQLAETFPALTHAQLVALTHRVDPERFAPGSVILQRGAPVERFHVILSGRVEVLVPQADGSEKVVATFSRGNYFGEVELVRGGPSIATVRATRDAPVELLRLDRAAFDELLAQAPAVRAHIARVVQERVAENLAAQQEGAR
jgi:ABC-type lipoprotein export system ATPase subunit